MNLPGNADRVVPHALQLADNQEHGGELAQVARHRRLSRHDANAPVAGTALQLVDHAVFATNVLSLDSIMTQKRLHGAGNGVLNQ